MAQTYNLNLVPGRGVVSVWVSQYDIGREIQFVLYNGDEEFTPTSGTVIVCNGTKNDGTGFATSTTWSGSTVTVLTDATMTDICGVSECELVLTVGDTRIGTANFTMIVEQAGVSENTEFNDAQIAYVADALTRIGDCDSAYQTLNGRIDNIVAPQGDPSLTEVSDARFSALSNTTYASLTTRIASDVAAVNTKAEAAPSLAYAANVSVIPDETDFNDLDIGTYRVTSSAHMQTMVNSPTSAAAKVFVMATTSTTRKAQIVIPTVTEPKIFFRALASNSGWTNWITIGTTDATLSTASIPADAAATGTAIANAIQQCFALRYSDATAIPANTDLDTLTTPGNYVVTSASNAATMTNAPTTSTAYRLTVMHLHAVNRYVQLATMATGGSFSKMAIRINVGSWGQWLTFATEKETIVGKNVVVTSDNYTTHFPNGLLSDAEPNTIYGINNSSLFADAPYGDGTYGMHDGNRGYLRGTLVTFTTANDGGVTSGLTQIFVGYRNTDYSPTLSYRIAIENNGYVWSNWSKFEENGFLHSSNMIVYGGKYQYTIDDLDDAPNNSIIQIDLNNDESDASHTLAHNPMPGVSCVMMTYAFSNTTDHGKVQTLFALNGKMFWRYGYQNTSTEYRWTSWKLVNPNVPAIPEAPSSDGTYTLRCTVSGSTKTYSWVSV